MDSYDVVILGAGAGAKLIWGSVPGRSVAVVEQHRVGGDCPFVACVPSKAMLRSAQVWRLAADPQWSGLSTGQVSGRDAYDHAVQRRDRIVHDRQDATNVAALEKAGATLLRGHGQIVRPGVVSVDGIEVGYQDLVLDTGSEALRPGIAGLQDAEVWTSDQALSATKFPTSAVVVGGGPVGCELAFLFATFGTTVTLVQRDARLVPREEPEVSAALLTALTGRAVDVRLNSEIKQVTRANSGARITLKDGRDSDEFAAEVVILAAGRRPRSADLGLNRLGVEPDSKGAVIVDETCRVSGVNNLWAIGDVTGAAPFTHTAHYQGRIVAANLSGRSRRANYDTVPRAVYVDPTVVSVGHTVASARAVGIEPLVARASMNQTVRAATEGAPEGWVQLLADPVRGVLIGATALGGHAEEWISEISLTIRAQIPLAVAADVVHPFPTFSEVLEAPLGELAARLS